MTEVITLLKSNGFPTKIDSRRDWDDPTIIYNTLDEPARRNGLLFDDSHWIKCLEEARMRSCPLCCGKFWLILELRSKYPLLVEGPAIAANVKTPYHSIRTEQLSHPDGLHHQIHGSELDVKRYASSMGKITLPQFVPVS